MERKQTLILRELYKISKMGMEASEILLPKVRQRELKSQIASQAVFYRKIASKTKDMLKLNGVKPREQGALQRRVLQSAIQMNTLFDKSPQHISEMMINGTVMGMISMNRTLNRCRDAGPEGRKLADEYLSAEQRNIDGLKRFL